VTRLSDDGDSYEVKLVDYGSSVIVPPTALKPLRFVLSGFHYCWTLVCNIEPMWNILTALQLFAMTIIPVFMLLLTHPQVTITSIMFLLLIPFGFTLVDACILYQCQKLRRVNFQSNARCCGSMCLYFVMIITTIGLILTLVALYEVMLLVQVQIETGVKGIVLSLLPSFPLSALGSPMPIFTPCFFAFMRGGI